MTFDGYRWTSVRRDTFDDIRIESSLCQELCLEYFLCLFLENLNEFVSNDLALFFGINYSFQLVQKSVSCVNGMQVYRKIILKCFNNLFCLVISQKTVVDENAGQVIAYGLVDERCSDSRINPTR